MKKTTKHKRYTLSERLSIAMKIRDALYGVMLLGITFVILVVSGYEYNESLSIKTGIIFLAGAFTLIGTCAYFAQVLEVFIGVTIELFQSPDDD